MNTLQNWTNINLFLFFTMLCNISSKHCLHKGKITQEIIALPKGSIIHSPQIDWVDDCSQQKG
jgi:hypothetical protein